MEELNEMQPTNVNPEENVSNEELQPVAEQTPAANDANTINTNENAGETTPAAEAESKAEVTPAEDAPAASEPKTEEAPAVEAQAETEEPAAEPVVDYSAMTREELLAALEELMQEADVSKIRNRASAIRNQFNILNKDVEKQAFDAFLAEGGNKDDYKAQADSVAEAFFKLYDNFRARRQKMQEELEAQKQHNLEAKQQILEELRVLIDKDEETLKQTYDEFNAIQEKWKAIGEVPREQMNDLWQNYHFLIEQFFNKVKINKELRMLDLKRNLEQKIQLCERAEELIVETSVVKAFKALQDLRAQWREIGPVPAEQNEETWQRFNNAANQIDERRREYYDQRKEELDQNLLAKQALIEKAEELTATPPSSTKQWNDTTTGLDDLLKLWKSIGPVPREHNEEVWNKFKGIIDQFYADKKVFFSQRRDEHAENYHKKVDICLRAEAIAKREDWKNATEELLQLQEEWKTVGPTNYKLGDKLWHRFRKACDEFFAKKAEFYKDIRTSESENLTKKQAIIEELKAHTFGDDRNENLEAIKSFQRRWSEIGHVPRQDKERLQQEFRSLINSIFEKLKISAREAEENSFRERVRSHGESRGFVNSEKNTLLNKIDHLRADLSLWENNLGFLANSKQADLLKAEFEKKMQAARQQIALLEAKVRILDEAEKNKENE